MKAIDLIGNTPLVEIEKGIFAKAEYLNPSGSVKDRIAKYIIEKAEEKGKLKKGMKIVEASSGNTAIALAMISAIKGYEFIAYMPKSVSKERAKLIKHFGGKVYIAPCQVFKGTCKTN